MITIFLNGHEREVEPEIDLARLLESLSLPSQRIAIELNRSVVLRTNWEQTRVTDGDRIEIVQFVGGG